MENNTLQNNLDNCVSNNFSVLTSMVIADVYEYLKGLIKKGFNLIYKKKQFANAYRDYFKKSFEKISKVKTFFSINNPVDLCKIYEKPDFKFKGKKVLFEYAEQFFNKNNKLLVIGTGGIGKTMFLKYLFLEALSTGTHIPIFISLRDVEPDENADFLERSIFNSASLLGFRIDYETFLKSIFLGKYLFLFDGFDEIKEENCKKIEKSLDEFSQKYGDNRIAVSSRPDENEFKSWNEFYTIEALPFDLNKAISCVKKYDFDEVIKSDFVNKLANGFFEKYISFIGNPLLLNILFITYSQSLHEPSNEIDFYDEAFNCLFYKHDAFKGQFIREIKSKLSLTDFKQILTHVCFHSEMKEEYSYTYESLCEYIDKAKKAYPEISEFKTSDFISDLKSSVCLIYIDGTRYTYVHRSFQEFFSSVYINLMTDDVQTCLYKLIEEKGIEYRLVSIFKMVFHLNNERFIENFVCKTLNIFPSNSKYNSKTFYLTTLFSAFQFVKGEIVGITYNPGPFTVLCVICSNRFRILPFGIKFDPKIINKMKKSSLHDSIEINELIKNDSCLEVLLKGTANLREIFDDLKRRVERIYLKKADNKNDFSSF